MKIKKSIFFTSRSESRRSRSPVPVCVDCLFLRSPSRVPYRTELRNSSRVRLKGGVPGPPTRNPRSRIHRRPSGLPTALQERHGPPKSSVTVTAPGPKHSRAKVQTLKHRDQDYGWGVRVRRPFGARGMSSVWYGTRLGDLKENWFL